MSELVEVKLTGDMELDLSRFEQKVKDIVLFSGVAAMAKSQYDSVRAACPVSDHAHFFYGTSSKKTGQRYYFASGNLKAAIYRVYSPERSDSNKKTYRISWNHQKAPYGFMVEFGTSKAPAHPFVRPAFDNIREAIRVGQKRMKERLADGVVEVAP